MKDELIKRRDEAESTFNTIKTSFDAIKAELDKYGAKTLTDLKDEMNRLQGEYRVLKDFIDKTPNETQEAETVSKKANVIDATKVKGA
jgi:division protein CdvB (Snf7/Vps24/ESCRT-III family)